MTHISLGIDAGIIRVIIDRTGVAGLIQFFSEMAQDVIDFAIEHKVGFATKKIDPAEEIPTDMDVSLHKFRYLSDPLCSILAKTI